MKTALTLVGFICFISCFSQANKIDQSFGNNGFVITKSGDSANSFDIDSKVILQPDGKILVSGNFSNRSMPEIIRYLSNGMVDSSFGNNGLTSIDSLSITMAAGYRMRTSTVYASITAIIIQLNGKILIGGNMPFNSFLVRLMPNGKRDTDFGNDGEITSFNTNTSFNLCAFALQSDGKILIAGSVIDPLLGELSFYVFNGNILIRLNNNGTPDTAFAKNGIAENKIPMNERSKTAIENSCVTIQPDGKIITAGMQYGNEFKRLNFVLIRYNVNGTIDKHFGKKGTVITATKDYDNNIGSLIIQKDGKIIIGGYYAEKRNQYRLIVLRYKRDGKSDHDFGNKGRFITPFDNKIQRSGKAFLQPDGKIILAGGIFTTRDYADSFAIYRINNNGVPDNTFGIKGRLIIVSDKKASFQDGILQPDDKIVLAGNGSHLNSTTVLIRCSLK